MNERERAMLGRDGAAHYRSALADAAARAAEVARLHTVVPAQDMEWETSPQGRIKHMVNAGMKTREFCLDVYMQVLDAGGRSGRHRHFTEEVVYILEGSGYDLHWDPVFDADVRYEWRWEEEPKRFEWQVGDFVYIPPYVVHQHVASPGSRARFISATSRLPRMMGFDGLEQVAEPES
jgi:quercetin dioxygenase-like cupin family protein